MTHLTDFYKQLEADEKAKQDSQATPAQEVSQPESFAQTSQPEDTRVPDDVKQMPAKEVIQEMDEECLAFEDVENAIVVLCKFILNHLRTI
jgi:hypothetical protein